MSKSAYCLINVSAELSGRLALLALIWHRLVIWQGKGRENEWRSNHLFTYPFIQYLWEPTMCLAMFIEDLLCASSLIISIHFCTILTKMIFLWLTYRWGNWGSTNLFSYLKSHQLRIELWLHPNFVYFKAQKLLMTVL